MLIPMRRGHRRVLFACKARNTRAHFVLVLDFSRLMVEGTRGILYACHGWSAVSNRNCHRPRCSERHRGVGAARTAERIGERVVVRGGGDMMGHGLELPSASWAASPPSTISFFTHSRSRYEQAPLAPCCAPHWLSQADPYLPVSLVAPNHA